MIAGDTFRTTRELFGYCHRYRAAGASNWQSELIAADRRWTLSHFVRQVGVSESMCDADDPAAVAVLMSLDEAEVNWRLERERLARYLADGILERV